MSRTTGASRCRIFMWKGAERMSALIPFGPVAPSAKPVFDPPDGWKYRVDGVQMELSWRPDFGAEKTAALQKAQFALAQEAARLIDSYVPFDTGQLKNSVQTASNYEEGLLVYNTPYARKQYYLHPEGEALHGDTGLRGSYWGQRAIAGVGEHLALFGAKAVTTFWGGMGHL
nr:MAG TPA: Minor capsid protein [Caudoviricetes sp.]